MSTGEPGSHDPSLDPDQATLGEAQDDRTLPSSRRLNEEPDATVLSSRFAGPTGDYHDTLIVRASRRVESAPDVTLPGRRRLSLRDARVAGHLRRIDAPPVPDGTAASDGGNPPPTHLGARIPPPPPSREESTPLGLRQRGPQTQRSVSRRSRVQARVTLGSLVAVSLACAGGIVMVAFTLA